MARTLKKEINIYKGAIALERLFSRVLRRIIRVVLYISTISLFAVLVLYVVEASDGFKTISVQVLYNDAAIFLGWFLISFSLLFFVSMLSFYYNSRYYRGIEAITHGGELARRRGISYEVAEVLLKDNGDVTTALFSSKYGVEMLNRCNIGADDIIKFLSGKKTRLPLKDIELPDSGFLTLGNIAGFAYKFDEAVEKFLFDHGVTEEIYKGAVMWMMQTYHISKHDTRWWSRDNLGKVAVIGKDWSLGGAYLLENYSRDIRSGAVFSVLSDDVAYADEKITQIESVLSRSKAANVILVGEKGVGKMDIILRLYQNMTSGIATPTITKKRMIVFDTERFIAAHDSKEALEMGMVALFEQAVKAGNIIMVIDDLPNFLENAGALGVNVSALVDVYLASPNIQLIATSEPISFHQSIETKSSLIQRMERVQIENPDLSSSIRILQNIAYKYERRFRILFTYPAVVAIAESADRYITDGVMPDKAVELLAEIAPFANRKKIKIITKETIFEFITEKTGVPTGPVKKEERGKLMNLERILHERVIGQEYAIDAISGVMRRARAGVQDEHRPLGSFLFLGSTGVGKTETSKALARVFFGSEGKMSRIDMSEFSASDAVERLIGTDSKVGVLPRLLKQKPYSVLLLDEFEKATSEVHDLFLQIIDEGIFTDGKGSKINARNSIIIATSNAGSNMIWELVKKHENPSEHKDEIIEAIIRDGIYKPELINRFDGAIIFEPLSIEQQERIAKIMLVELKERIYKKGYDLVVDEVLINLLVKEGYDPEFGARPMRRVLQDKIEEKIASKIIEGGLKLGDKIWFYEEDFSS